MNDKNIQQDNAIAGKATAIVVIALAAVLLSVAIARVTFTRILPTVNALSQPDKKTSLIASLFSEAAILGTLQNYTDENASGYDAHLNVVQKMNVMLDSLRILTGNDALQSDRIDSMKLLINKRKKYYETYILLRDRLNKSDTISEKVNDMSALIVQVRPMLDSPRIITTKETRIITDTISVPKGKSSFWSRLTGKKNAEEKIIKQRVEEVLNIHIDTAATLAKADSLVALNAQIARLEQGRLQQRKNIRAQRMKLGSTDAAFITRLTGLLKDIETTSQAEDKEKSSFARESIVTGLKQSGYLLTGFVLCILILVMFLFQDIARNKKYKNALIDARQKAEDAGKARQRFLANMSHELRTPLQTIIGLSEQMKMEGTVKANDLNKLHNSSLHLLQTVNQILDYSRIVSGKLTLTNEPFSVNEVTKDVIDMVQVQAEKKGLLLWYQNSSNTDVTVYGDSFRLRQILLNLLGNAIKYTIHGSVTLSVNINKTNGEYILLSLSVSDTGPGIREEEKRQLFEEFEQAHDNDKHKGTGLGLSIVKHIVDMHNGTIAVTSDGKTGSEFQVQIPYPMCHTAVTGNNSANISATQNHVWIADDDETILELTGRILKRHGIPHTCFHNGTAMTDSPIPKQLSYVLMDIRMGDINGIELQKTLRNRKDMPESTIFVAFTAQALPDEQSDILNTGFDKLLTKPFTEQTLLAALSQKKTDIAEHEQPSLDAIMKMAGNDNEVVISVLNAFIEQTTTDVAHINNGIKENSPFAIADALHRLASRMGQLGLSELAAKLRAAENALRNEDADISVFPAALLPAITNTMQFLSSWIKNNNNTTKC